FSYPMPAELEPLVRDPRRFEAYAAQRRRDVESILAGYDIAEKATRRGLLGELLQMDMLEGRYDDALRRSAEIRTLQEKPADKALSGMTTRAIVAAIRKTGGRNTSAYSADVGRQMAEELERIPFATVRNEIQGSKAGMETLSEALVMGSVR